MAKSILGPVTMHICEPDKALSFKQSQAINLSINSEIPKPVRVVPGITDPDGDPATVKITSIHQDEPTKAKPSDPSPDGAGIGTNTAQIRAERTMPGDGRVYHIDFTADDGKGKTCNGEVIVSIPPDQAHSAIDSAPPSYDSTR
jgi:hypothetical protein